MNKLEEEFIECPVCNRKMQFIVAQHIAKHGYTTKEFKKKFNISCLKVASLANAHSKLMLENNPMQGVIRSNEEKALISKMRTGKGIGVVGKYERTKEIREKISLGVTAAYLEGRCESSVFNLNFGDYIRSSKMNRWFWCRSPYEERMVLLLDVMPEVQFFDVEPFRIPYVLDGINRNYIPDFWFKEKDSNIEWLLEFKRTQDWLTPKGIAKKAALQKYCSDNKMNCMCIDKETLNKIEDAYWHLVEPHMDAYMCWRKL